MEHRETGNEHGDDEEEKADAGGNERARNMVRRLFVQRHPVEILVEGRLAGRPRCLFHALPVRLVSPALIHGAFS